MAAAYAKTTNAAVNAALIAGATADATTTVTYPTAAELLGIVARGSASVYAATAGLANPFARNMVVSTGQWSNIMSLNDAGRPIYTASQPMNAGGQVAPTSLTGNVAGLNLYVDPTNGGDGDGTILIVNPDAYTWYESPTYRLRAESTAAGQQRRFLGAHSRQQTTVNCFTRNVPNLISHDQVGASTVTNGRPSSAHNPTGSIRHGDADHRCRSGGLRPCGRAGQGVP